MRATQSPTLVWQGFLTIPETSRRGSSWVKEVHGFGIWLHNHVKLLLQARASESQPLGLGSAAVAFQPPQTTAVCSTHLTSPQISFCGYFFHFTFSPLN